MVHTLVYHAIAARDTQYAAEAEASTSNDTPPRSSETDADILETSSDEPADEGYIQQPGLLFTLPPEIRREIYKWTFYALASKHTIKPQHSWSDNEGEKIEICNRLIARAAGMDDLIAQAEGDEGIDDEDDDGDDTHQPQDSKKGSALGDEAQSVDGSHMVQQDPSITATSDKQDLTAILRTCCQIHDEAVDTWRRLPQFFQSFRDIELYHEPYFGTDIQIPRLHLRSSFSTLSHSAAWLALQDLTITVAAIPEYLDPDEHPVAEALFFDAVTRARLCNFAKLLAFTCSSLRRLHLMPSFMDLEPSGNPVAFQPYTRLGSDILQDQWKLLGPFACLPSHVKVTTQGRWEGYDDRMWHNPEETENCSDLFVRLCEEGFDKIRKQFAGRNYEDWHGDWSVPGCVDDDGTQLYFASMDDMLEPVP